MAYVNPEILDAARVEANRVRAGLPLAQITNHYPESEPKNRDWFSKFVAELAESDEQRKIRMANAFEAYGVEKSK